MALYMEILRKRQSKPSTLANNRNALNIFSKLWRDEDVKSLTLAQFEDAGKLLSGKFRDLRKLSTLNHYLSCINSLVKFVLGLKEFKL